MSSGAVRSNEAYTKERQSKDLKNLFSVMPCDQVW